MLVNSNYHFVKSINIFVLKYLELEVLYYFVYLLFQLEFPAVKVQLKPVVEVMLAMGWCKIYTTTALCCIGFWPCAGSGSAGCDPALISCSGWGWPKSAVVRIFAIPGERARE